MGIFVIGNRMICINEKKIGDKFLIELSKIIMRVLVIQRVITSFALNFGFIFIFLKYYTNS